MQSKSCAQIFLPLILQTPTIRAPQLQQALLLQILDNLSYSLLNTRLVAPYGDLRVFRRLVGGADARKLGDLAFTSLLVEALGIPLLRLLERNVDENFDESERVILGMGS
jgi:hypothetical protein